MGFLIIDKMLERTKIAKGNNDTDYFNNLMYLGEMIIKIITLGLVAAIDNDTERHQYIQEHRLVRADGIGEWRSVIEEIVQGPTRNYLINEIHDITKEMTIKCKENTWQFDCTKELYLAAQVIANHEPIPTTLNLMKWFAKFPELRNSTRGHGATFDNQCSKMNSHLEKSLIIMINSFLLLKKPWCYLFQNLSGKYRVTNYSDNTGQFDFLKNSKIINQKNKYENGAYIFYDQPRRVNLIFSDADATDFYFLFGNFNDRTKSFEVISYLTNTIHTENGDKYLKPITDLPNSETQGIKKLDVQGNSFGNLPPVQNGYITRMDLEKELYNILIDDRHPIITLFGRGGIGKTWLTLKVLHKIAEEEKFTFILWFSARDIDLLLDGPKTVKAHVQSIAEISSEFANLYSDFEKKGDRSAEEFISSKMQKNDDGNILFVFDNFETVKAPTELYTWIDTYIRLPNKVLITSRIRDFRVDYPIEVSGMN
jgi:hypothetical protein